MAMMSPVRICFVPVFPIISGGRRRADPATAPAAAIILAMRRPRTATLLLLLAVALVLAGSGSAVEYARGAAFVARAAGASGVVRRVAEWRRQPVTETALEIPWRGGRLRARRYQPNRPTGRPLLLLPGVHASGIDEPRLIGFAIELASIGHPTVTAELSDLTRYSITARSPDMIEDATIWLAQQPDLPRDGQIGLMGISFAGGLAIVAAGRPAIRDRVAFVMSFGGHGDLPRTLHYLATGIQADGAHRPPHDYGVAIILLGVAGQVVPAAQAPALRAAILSFLEASHLDMVDKAQAAREFGRARTLAGALPEPARTLMTYVNDRDVARLGPILVPHLTALSGDAALSPDRAPPPACRVYLLHGADDNVIPAIESALLARTLRDRGVAVRFLATPLVTHAEVDHSAAVSSAWALVRFWSAVLAD
jgi:dienelactone hydrolase